MPDDMREMMERHEAIMKEQEERLEKIILSAEKSVKVLKSSAEYIKRVDLRDILACGFGWLLGTLLYDLLKALILGG